MPAGSGSNRQAERACPAITESSPSASFVPPSAGAPWHVAGSAQSSKIGDLLNTTDTPTVAIEASDDASAAGPQLGRSLARRHVALIALGGVVGAGLFVGSSASINAVGPAVVFSYLAAGAIVYALMAMIGQLALAHPQVQAFPELIRASAGRGLGFVLGWTYWFMWTLAIAIEALAGAALLQSWIALPTWALSALLVAVMMGINLLPTRVYGEFEFWFSSIKVAAIVVFVVLAALHCFGSGPARELTWKNLTDYQGFMPHGVTAVAAGVVTVFFSLTGAELATIAAAESREKVATSQFAATLIGRIVLFYVASTFLIVCAVPWTQIVPGISPFTTALQAMGFQSAELIMAGIIATALVSCLNSAFYVSSRVLFSLAAHADAPPYLGRLSSRRVPVHGVLFATLSASLCLVVGIVSPKRAFAFLVNSTGTLIIFTYLMVCVTYLIQCRREMLAQGRTRARRSVVLRWVAYLVMVSLSGVLVAMAATPQLASQLYISAAAIGVCAGAYLVVSRRRARSSSQTGSWSLTSCGAPGPQGEAAAVGSCNSTLAPPKSDTRSSSP
jgi:GABA permease